VAPHQSNISIDPVLAFAGSAIAAMLWVAAIVAVPGFQSSGLSVILVRIVVHVLLLGGAWAGLARTSLTPSERTRTWLAIAIPLTLWHAGAWVIVSKGLLRPRVSERMCKQVSVSLPYRGDSHDEQFYDYS
jgi:hypothetical protein